MTPRLETNNNSGSSNNSSSPSKGNKRSKFSKLIGGNKSKTSEREPDKAEECKPTIIWFGFSFAYEAQRSQVCCSSLVFF